MSLNVITLTFLFPTVLILQIVLNAPMAVYRHTIGLALVQKDINMIQIKKLVQIYKLMNVQRLITLWLNAQTIWNVPAVKIFMVFNTINFPVAIKDLNVVKTDFLVCVMKILNAILRIIMC